MLTSHWRDTPEGVALTFWLATDNGPVRVRSTGERAIMFIERDVRAQADERKPVELETLWREPVDALYFRRRGALLDERDRLQREGFGVLESDIRPNSRYLMERFITGGCRVRGRAATKQRHTELTHAAMKQSDYRPKLTHLSIDIETDGADGPVLSIAAANDDIEQVWVAGSGPEAPGVRYVADERALLGTFFDAVSAIDPDAIIGWNVVEFDLLHLQTRAKLHNLPLGLGRGSERAAILEPRSETQLPLPRLPGRVALDGIATLKAATYSFERFTLEHVSQKLLGRGKAIEHTGDPVAEIRRMYHEDKVALARYNLEDCRLVNDIFKATDLLAFAVERQQMTGLPMDRVGGSVAAFDHLYLPRLHRHGFVAADVGAVRGATTSPGGYVLSSKPGLYRNVLVLDFKSLYPSIIRTFKIDPLGMQIAGDDAIQGFEGARFDRDKHILPEMIASLWAERDRAKRADDQALSRAIKIVMNSFYGVLGTPGCRFFSPKLASSITRRGHEIITKSRDWITDRGRDVIYGDTDSLFVLVGEGSVDDAMAVGRALTDGLNAWWTDHIADEHRTESHLEMELEVCYARFFMPTLRGSTEGSAKRYAGWVARDDKVVIKGLEAVRTDWTHLARTFQRQLLSRVFHDQPVDDYVRETRARLFAGDVDDALVYRKRLRRDVSAYVSNMPPHVKAASMLDRPVRDVAYVWTTRGPQPLEKQDAPLDYHHYVEKQLTPASDAILSCLGTSFDKIAGSQLRLF